jgi:hypothetical protein
MEEVGARRTKETPTMKRSLVAVTLTAVGLVLTVGIQLAQAAPNRASLTVAPDPCRVGDQFKVEGAGFQAGNRVVVKLSRQCKEALTYSHFIWAGNADGRGAFTFSRTAKGCAGVYTLEARQTVVFGPKTRTRVSFEVK